MYRLSKEKENPDISQIQSDTIHVKDQMEAIYDTVFLLELEQYLEEGKLLHTLLKMVKKILRSGQLEHGVSNTKIVGLIPVWAIHLRVRLSVSPFQLRIFCEKNTFSKFFLFLLLIWGNVR